jgi:hypothetical protein
MGFVMQQWPSDVFAISTSLRAAVSGSLKGLARRTSCGFRVGDKDVLAHALNVDHCAAEASGLADR